MNNHPKLTQAQYDHITKLRLQEQSEEDTRMRNMRRDTQKVIVELCGQYGRVTQEQE